MKGAPQTPIEVALPSGIFAKIRPIKFLDIVIIFGKPIAKDAVPIEVIEELGASLPTAHMFIARMMQRVVLFDDKQLTLVEVLNLDARDTSKLADLLSPFMSGPVR